MSKKQHEELPALDEDQRHYRDYFGGITDRYLIVNNYDPALPRKNGYIVFIDRDYDIDYIDYREDAEIPDKQNLQRAIAKLTMAEAVPTRHLPDDVRLEFKRSLGAGYIHAINGNFEDIPEIISQAQDYLKKRNREYSRNIFLSSGLPAAGAAFIAGLVFYILQRCGVWGPNPWFYGIVFGILGSFVSIWTRYGKVNNSGMGGRWLHILECVSRITIGVIFALVAMVAIRCRLILPMLQESQELPAFIIASFIAAFSERFIPSIIEKITKDEDNSES